MTRDKEHFTYEFIMEDPSDPLARVALNAGSHDANVYIDNVSLKLADNMSIDQKNQHHPQSFTLYQNHPNPFNPATSIQFNLLESTYVRLTIYDQRGREITTLIDREMTAGFVNSAAEVATFLLSERHRLLDKDVLTGTQS